MEEIEWNNEACVKLKYDLVTETGIKVHTNVVSSTQMMKTLKFMLQSKVVVLYKREPQCNQV